MADMDSLTITVDCLNDSPFIDQMQNAIDVVNCAKRLAEKYPNDPESARTLAAVKDFLDWFRGNSEGS